MLKKVQRTIGWPRDASGRQDTPGLEPFFAGDLLPYHHKIITSLGGSAKGLQLSLKSLGLTENNFRSSDAASANLGCACIGKELPHNIFQQHLRE